MLATKKVPATKEEKRGAKPPSFRNLMTFRLHMVARLSERISEEYYRKHMDLSLPECRVIGITAGYGSVSFKRVAADANLEKSYASRVVSALVERGIVEKQANPSDSRSVLLQLTPEGHEVHERMYALAIRLNELLQGPFRHAQVNDFVAYLGTLEQQLERAHALIEDGADLNPLPAFVPVGEAGGDESGQPAMLDRAFARQLHDMLGKYLAGKE